jgi:amino acid transporter
MAKQAGAPRESLAVIDVIAVVVGIVIGAGIFKAPAMVAANTGSEAEMLLAWILGGAASLAGALCYAELTTTYPHTGGEYHYVARAFGKHLAFLFAWARMVVLQTGSIALLAFVLGDYAAQRCPGANPLDSALVIAMTVNRSDYARAWEEHACAHPDPAWSARWATLAAPGRRATTVGNGDADALP